MNECSAGRSTCLSSVVSLSVCTVSPVTFRSTFTTGGATHTRRGLTVDDDDDDDDDDERIIWLVRYGESKRTKTAE